jgi:hypothetical protein
MASSEDLVFFLKPDEAGNPDMLEVNGKPLFLNGDLFDVNFTEPFNRWAKSLDDHYQAVPTVDHNGTITEAFMVKTHRPIDLSKVESPKS